MIDPIFGIDTLIIPAVLVPAGDQDAAQAAMSEVGADAVRLPAILVPPGTSPPGGDYVMIGTVVSGASDTDAETPPAPSPATDEGPTPPPPLHAPAPAPANAQARDPIAAGTAARRAMGPATTGRALAKPAKPG